MRITSSSAQASVCNLHCDVKPLCYIFQFEAGLRVSESRTWHNTASPSDLHKTFINNKMLSKWRENSSVSQTSSWLNESNYLSSELVSFLRENTGRVWVSEWGLAWDRHQEPEPMSGQWSVVCGPRSGLSQGTREKTGARVTVSSLITPVAFCRRGVKTLLSDL